MDILTFITGKLAEMTLDEVRQLADEVGIPSHTLLKIRYGETRDPRIGTLTPLIEHFKIGRCQNCDDA